jgi:hypothetical protein
MRFATVLLLTVFGLCGTSIAQQWREYRPAAAGYRIEFPGTPQPVTRTVQTPHGEATVTVSVLARDKGAFISNHTVLPAEIKQVDPQAVLDDGRDAGVAQVKGQLRDERRLTVDGAPARRIVIDIPPNKVSLLLAVLDGEMLYQAMYVGYRGSENEPDAERFLGSFRLVDR